MGQNRLAAIFCAVLFLLASAPAGAFVGHVYYFVGRTEVGMTFIDSQSLQDAGHLKSAWVLWVYVPEKRDRRKKVQYALERDLFDCKARTLGVSSVYSYDASRRLLWDSDFSGKQFPVAPESISDTLMDAACKRLVLHPDQPYPDIDKAIAYTKFTIAKFPHLHP